MRINRIARLPACLVPALACLWALSWPGCKPDGGPAADGGRPRLDASAAGTGSDAAARDASDATDVGDLDDGGTPACQPCIGNTVGWGPNGGLVARAYHSELAACNKYRHTAMPTGADPSQASLSCERPLPCMGSGLHGISDVLQALEDADVVAARAKGNVLYGVDSRPVDGTVLRIELAGSVIEVGNACGGTSGCVAIPSGIAMLASLLGSIDTEQLAIEPCLSEFN